MHSDPWIRNDAKKYGSILLKKKLNIFPPYFNVITFHTFWKVRGRLFVCFMNAVHIVIVVENYG
jgi:hypothetical protein